MDLFELYRAIRRHNPNMAIRMHQDLLALRERGIAIEIDTDDDFYVEFQNEDEEEMGGFTIKSFSELRDALNLRVPEEKVYDSRKASVARFFNEAIYDFMSNEQELLQYAEQHGVYTHHFNWGNWSMTADIKLPIKTYRLFGQDYEVTDEVMARIKEDVECLPTPEESAQ